MHAAVMPFFPTLDIPADSPESQLTVGQSRAPGPVFDPSLCAQPLDSHNEAFLNTSYTLSDPTQDYNEPSVAPSLPPGFSDPYLFPVMNKNERLRLTMLWYVMRDALHNGHLLARLQEKVNLVSDFVGWEFCIMGILDHATYTRIVTVGVPTVVLPRRESTCSHTINHPPGSILWVPDMSKDWRFEKSPHVLHGGLKSYAGTSLLCQTGDGSEVPLGSLCVASNEPGLQLSVQQQKALKRVAHMLVKEIIDDRRLSRQRQRQQFLESIHELEQHLSRPEFETRLLETVSKFYPDASVSLRRTTAGQVKLKDGFIASTADAHNGLWENEELFDELIKMRNHTELQTEQIVRVLIAQVGSLAHELVLVVETSDISLIFDDVDARYVEQCARLVSLASQQRQLDAATKAKDLFLRGITHQLRTPIHGILGATELLAEEFNLKSPRSRSKTSIQTPRSSIYSQLQRGRSDFPEKPAMTSLPERPSLSAHSQIQARGTVSTGKLTRISLREKTDHTNDRPLRSRSAGCVRSLGNTAPESSQGEEQAMDRTLQFLETINNSGKELMSTVNNILKLNKWAEINTNLPGVPFLCDVHQLECDLVQELQEALSPEELMDVSLVFDNNFDEGATLSLDNGELLRDSVLALVINAIQWSPKGVVSVNTELKSTILSITVTDNGPGIAPAHWKNIFEPYEKVDQHTRGAGLGLTLASKFAEALGGKLSLAWSKLGSGSTFVLELPRAGLGGLVGATNPKQITETTSLECRLLPTSTSAPHPLTAHFIQHIKRHGMQSSINSPGLIRAIPELDVIDLSLELDVLEKCMSCRDPTRLTACIVPSEAFLELINRTSLQEHVLLFHGPLTTRRLNEITSQLSDAYQQQESHSSNGLHKAEDNLLAPEPKLTLRQRYPPSRVALLVDDNPINLTILRMFCRKRGIPYHEAVNGEQASRIFQEEREPPISLVLMDLQMPVCDGLDATRRIRQIEANECRSRCALFMITGQDSVRDRENSYEAGADQFMVKPVRMKALDATIDAHFNSVAQSTMA